MLATVLGGGVVGLAASDANSLLRRFAPLSGGAWSSANRNISETVESPYGPATIRRDGDGVPHIEAEDERAASFAVGYVQAFDRLFQLDIQRRQMRGQLSELAGEATLDSDEFHVRMDFVGAAEATWEALSDSSHAPLVEAYSDGVNAAIDGERLPLEFALLEYEPAPWTPVDTTLLSKQIAWTLTGDFSELRRARIADALGEDTFEQLYPEYIDHDVPILRDGVATTGDVGGVSGETGDDASPARPESLRAGDGLSGTGAGVSSDTETGRDETHETTTAADADDRPWGGSALVDWLTQFESPTGVGSNSWVLSGEHTESGRPLVANDPHLLLQTPPLWYEQHVVTDDADVRGFTFPGVPFVVIGANAAGAWGFTNVGADVLDCYRYEIDEDGDRYRYDGEWREFDSEERTIAVAGADDVTITQRKTVHGPLIEREGEQVGVAWTGLSATRTPQAVYEISRSDGVDDVIEATRKFDVPTQNLVYADADGRTLYYATGKLPIRNVDGDVVSGNRIFDGSAGEGEWEGFTPYGESSWEGFVPFDEQPHAIDPELVATANQRVADEPTHYVGTSYATPYRGDRLYEVLDDAVETDESTDLAFHRRLQTDTEEGRADGLVTELVAAVDDAADTDDRLVEAAESLDEWDRRMDRDSTGALLFARWFEHFTTAVCEPTFDDAGLDEEYYPNDWVIATLPDDSELFGDRTRAETMVAALAETVDELDDEEWSEYGEYNTTEPIAHPFGSEAPFLDLAVRPIDGSRTTVNNYRVESSVGASIRLLAEPGGETLAILPGGNSGDYFSSHYDDQFQRWVDGEYRSLALEVEGDLLVTVEEGSR